VINALQLRIKVEEVVIVGFDHDSTHATGGEGEAMSQVSTRYLREWRESFEVLGEA